MCVDDLQNRIEEAKAKGWKPFLVIGRDQKQINDLLISERSIRPATFSPFIQFSDFLQFRIFDFRTQQVLWSEKKATAGTTVLGAFDPIAEISKVAQEHDIWLHVDVSLETDLSSKVAFSD